MTGPLFFRFDPIVAGGYAFLVGVLVVAYRRAATTRGRLAVYLLSLILVLSFLLLFAPH